MYFDTREELLLQLFADHALINEILVGPYAKVCLQKLGIKYGLGLEDRYRGTEDNRKKGMSADEFAEMIQLLLVGIGGKYSLKSVSGGKLEFACEQCPFEHMILKSPILCEVVVGIIGGIASRNFPYCKISVPHSLAKQGYYCQIIVYLEQSAEAERSSGQVFTNERTSYIVTRNEMTAVKDAMQHKLYDSYLQGFEDLKLIYHEMKTEYNQLRDEIFSDLKLGVLTVNSANEITYMNKTAQDILHMETKWDSPEGMAFQKILADTLSEKTRYNQYIHQVPFADGVRYYSVNASPLYDEAGNVSGAVSVFQDVTQKKILEDELLQMEKFSLIAELAAGTAHEIRNPMTTLRGFLQILSQEFRPDTKGFEYCSLMIDEIDRANSIIKEFLLLTKPAAPHLIETDLHTILEEIFLLIESKSLLENVELRKQYAKVLPFVKADPSQIKQVFLNLATNAIQSMPVGGLLTIATQAKDGKAVISFRDTGCGMEKSHVSKIFDPFFTTKENGTGLGLTISYRIIESHGGRIFVESMPGKGSTFTIELPAL